MKNLFGQFLMEFFPCLRRITCTLEKSENGVNGWQNKIILKDFNERQKFIKTYKELEIVVSHHRQCPEEIWHIEKEDNNNICACI